MAAGTLIAETTVASPKLSDGHRQADRRKIGDAVLLDGSADFTGSYAAAGTSNYLRMIGYAAVAFAVRLVSGTAPTSIEITPYFAKDMDATPVDYVSMNDSTSAGTVTMTVCEITLTYTSAAAFVTRPIPVAGRFLKIKAKRTGGDATTRIEILAWPITHIR
jgi:hypothetical protein